MKTLLLRSLAALCLLHLTAHAELQLPPLFSDNAVLQQGTSVPIWGWADDGEVITVKFRGQKVRTTAHNGKWSVALSKLKAGGPDTLAIATKSSALEFTNVLVGEVWICSGQSNMEWPMNRSFQPASDMASATNSQIRFFLVPKKKSETPTTRLKSGWVVCSPENIKGRTAVGYYFGRDLQAARNVPVGLIETYWGGSPVEAWMSRESLEINPRYESDILDAHTEAWKQYQANLTRYERDEAVAKSRGESFTNTPPRFGWRPCELYNGMIAPLIPYAFKGAIWYQGESNAGRAEQYRTLFPDMIRNWRRDWGQGDFPFLAVQLAPWKAIADQPRESDWAELREAQWLATKSLPNVGMAVITDVGDPKDIHPTKKQPVGERLALAARGIAYGEKIEYSGPLYRSMEVKDGRIILSFDHVGKGLEARDGELKGFAICGEDKKFVWAKAEIAGRTVVVSSPEVANPVAVRYGWADCPVVNFWNKDGLPASPFRTDDFLMITAGKK